MTFQVIEAPLEVYKSFNIRIDKTQRQFKVYAVVKHKVLWGSNLDILKRKIDKEVLK